MKTKTCIVINDEVSNICNKLVSKKCAFFKRDKNLLCIISVHNFYNSSIRGRDFKIDYNIGYKIPSFQYKNKAMLNNRMQYNIKICILHFLYTGKNTINSMPKIFYFTDTIISTKTKFQKIPHYSVRIGRVFNSQRFAAFLMWFHRTANKH